MNLWILDFSSVHVLMHISNKLTSDLCQQFWPTTKQVGGYMLATKIMQWLKKKIENEF